ncbi:hypothetical protein SAMN02746089_02513 [Caldanaerobius fijiensis DSM 17918]|uniref:Uncharacterized protein n=1 Tax=Caldanaerobius fijiensis DSM 17918 TaxID=1121256 RepID=A0A1M5EB06_9THEO|nr:hypothetical protein [Caldanaerobius fijiensis]SHF76408.1 hypothetical protein SAMN02746089_02513 [Caldanaerobius fijiensis DSM 17918]
MIKGLSEIRRLPRIGKIHLGVKDETNKGAKYPRAVDYFVVKLDENTPESSVNAFKSIYGDRPKELDIIFPSDDPNRFFPQWLKRYGGGKLLCKGDGETAQQVDAQTGEIKEIPCLYMECPHYKKKHCKSVGNLKFLIQGIPGGVWQIDTSSYYSIVNINSAIDIIKSANGGHIAGIPLKLVRNPIKVTADGKPKTIYVLNLYQPQPQPTKEEPKTENSGVDGEPELPDSDDLPEDLFPDDEPEPEPVEQVKNTSEEQTENNTVPNVSEYEPNFNDCLIVQSIAYELINGKKFARIEVCDTNGENGRVVYPKDPRPIIKAGQYAVLKDCKITKMGERDVLESYEVLGQKEAM